MKYVNTINENKCSSLLLYQGLGKESVNQFLKKYFSLLNFEYGIIGRARAYLQVRDVGCCKILV